MARQKINVPSGPAHPQDHCRLFLLPAEIRNVVYTLALTVQPDEHGQVVLRRQFSEGDSSEGDSSEEDISEGDTVLALLGTCCQINQEASGIFYYQHKLAIDYPTKDQSPSIGTDFAILGNMSPLRIGGLRNLTITLEAHWHVFEELTRLCKYLLKLSKLETLVIKIEPDSPWGSLPDIALVEREIPILKGAVGRLRSVKTLRFELPNVVVHSVLNYDQGQRLLDEAASALASKKTL